MGFKWAFTYLNVFVYILLMGYGIQSQITLNSDFIKTNTFYTVCVVKEPYL